MLGIFVVTGFWSVYSEISYRPGLTLVEEVRSGFSPVSWSQTREDLVKDRLSRLPNSCLWAHNEIKTTLSLMLLDRTFSTSSNFRGKLAALQDNLALSKGAIACTPMRHYLWLSLAKLQSVAGFDSKKMEQLLTFARRLSAVQNSDREVRIANYLTMPRFSQLLQMKPVQDDLVYAIRFDRNRGTIRLLKKIAGMNLSPEAISGQLRPEERTWLHKFVSLGAAVEG